MCVLSLSDLAQLAQENVHTYVHILKQFKALVPCDNSFHHFVLQDLNLETLGLKVFTSIALCYYAIDLSLAP